MTKAISPIFISHAVPTVLSSATGLAEVLSSFGAIAAPAAVVVANSHWKTDRPRVGIFDAGSMAELDLANNIDRLLKSSGFESAVEVMSRSAFDSHHSLWAPLSMMFGNRLPPIVTMSVQPSLGTVHHLRLGAALQPLTGRTLVVGSGSLTHNMVDVHPELVPGRYIRWAREFTDWVTQRVEAGDVNALLEYRKRAPHATHSHPQEDHLLPMFGRLVQARNCAAKCCMTVSPSELSRSQISHSIEGNSSEDRRDL